jgi:hypothetical protein
MTITIRWEHGISIGFASKTSIWIIAGLALSITFIAFRVSLYFVVKHRAKAKWRFFSWNSYT